MGFNGKALVTAVKNNSSILMLSGIGFIIAIIMLILVGIFSALVTEGTISVPTAINTSVTTLVTTATTALLLMVGVFSTLAGFVVVVALLAAFNINLSFGNKGM